MKTKTVINSALAGVFALGMLSAAGTAVAGGSR